MEPGLTEVASADVPAIEELSSITSCHLLATKSRRSRTGVGGRSEVSGEAVVVSEPALAILREGGGLTTSQAQPSHLPKEKTYAEQTAQCAHLRLRSRQHTTYVLHRIADRE